MSQEHVRILREARKLIKSHEHHHICFAVREAARGCVEGQEICAVIKQRLGDVCILESWLARGGHASWGEMNDNPVRLRITRLAWIDSLIEEFGGKP